MPKRTAAEQATTPSPRRRAARQQRSAPQAAPATAVASAPAAEPAARGLRLVGAGSPPTPAPDAPRPAVTLHVSVLHASLEHASYPLAIGHYDGDTIVGAEAVLDDKLDRRLSQRRLMNLYPGKVGTAEVILNPQGQPRGEIAGALVIGLGDVGELTPDIITRGVAEAAVRLALARLDAANSVPVDLPEPAPESRPGRPLSAAFSALLIGTRGGRALAIDSAVAAIVAGAMLANRALAEGDLLEKVCVDAVEFVELYGDIATRAAHALARIHQFLRITPSSNEIIQAEPFLQSGEGGYAGQPADDHDASWWQRLQIKATAPGAAGQGGELQFLLLTDRARAELTLQGTQRALVEQLIQKTIHEPGADLELPATLYELLLPNALKDQPLATTNLLFVIDAQAAQYPWEMLAVRQLGAVNGAGQPLLPLSVRVGMVRQLETGRFRAHVQAPHTRNALVIGEPLTGDPAYPALPGASAEAEAVAAILERFHYAVTRCIQTDALTIINALYAREYRIIHIAGHGVYQPDRPAQSGVVLGKEIYLTAAEIGQLRVTPELVFLNCCHLGVIDGEAQTDNGAGQPGQRAWNKLAASTAERLIEIGVRAVVAAGWAVDDRAAAQFAATLYQGMLSGDAPQFGDAVRIARRAIYDSHRAANTWGAYQCYGDPGFILQAGAGQAVAAPKRYVAPHEYLLELQNLQLRAARTRDKRWISRYKNDLRELEERLVHELPASWRNGELLAALGDTYAGLGAYPEAIAHYREALTASGHQGRVPLRTVEQLANCESTLALQSYVAGILGQAEQPVSNLDELMAQARKRLDLLLELAPNAERYGLLASFHQRSALVQRADEAARNAALAAAAAAHAAALTQPTVSGRANHSMGLLLCRFLQDQDFTAAARRQLLAELADVEERMRQEQAAEPGFWARIVEADIALLRALVSPAVGQIVQEEQALLAQYRRILDNRATTRQRLAVRERLVFLAAILEARGESDTAAVVSRIEEGLQ